MASADYHGRICTTCRYGHFQGHVMFAAHSIKPQISDHEILPTHCGVHHLGNVHLATSVRQEQIMRLESRAKPVTAARWYVVASLTAFCCAHRALSYVFYEFSRCSTVNTVKRSIMTN